MLGVTVIVLLVLVLAGVNGANDVAKGVATLTGSGALLGVRLADRANPSHVDALRPVLFGWIVTLPLAAAVSAISVRLIESF